VFPFPSEEAFATSLQDLASGGNHLIVGSSREETLHAGYDK
jgi:hypothetical protein